MSGTLELSDCSPSVVNRMLRLDRIARSHRALQGTWCPGIIRRGAVAAKACDRHRADGALWPGSRRNQPRRGPGILDIISTAQVLAARCQQGGNHDMIAERQQRGGRSSHVFFFHKIVPVQVIVIQVKGRSLWRWTRALALTLSGGGHHRLVVADPGGAFAFHWQSTRAREARAIIINEPWPAGSITALNRGRCGLWDWDLSRGRPNPSRSNDVSRCWGLDNPQRFDLRRGQRL